MSIRKYRSGRPHSGVPKSSRGFTLMELMIAVGIVAILARIAIPSYSSYVTKTRRAEAKAAIASAAQGLEKCFTISATYVVASCAAVADTSTTPDGDYTITFSPNVATGRTATYYKLIATPKSTGKQVNDTKCTSFMLDSTGLKTATGSDFANCW